MDESTQEFHLEEFKQMKQESSGLLARIETLARLGLVVSAAVYSWLAVQGFGPGVGENTWCTKLPPELLTWAWRIPLAYALLSGIAAFATYWRGRQMGDYLRDLETALGHPEFGWESRLKPKAPMLAATALLFWLLLIAGTWTAGAAGADFVWQAQAPCAKSQNSTKE